MPLFRGIEVSVLALSVAGQLPEYPHPDGSSCRHDTLHDSRTLPSAHSEVEASQQKQADPVISVYIPSAPGSQFWINYVVKEELSPPCHLFFKLYMNGRHITSWGINPRIKKAGRAEKALYEPSDRWEQEENGVIFKPEGIEARYFHFVAGQPETSVAEDGGVIEVQVFRAKGRKRRAARLDQYRHQDKYGITAPSGGLLDNPQDVTFYDFHLIDPKDAPFATFRFYYRSWDNLLQLNLIPSENLDHFESPATCKINDGYYSQSSPDGNIVAEEDSIIGVPSSFGRINADASVFDESTSSGDFDDQTTNDRKPRRNSSYILRTPPQLRPRSATSHNLPQPSKTFRDGVASGFPESILQRPLPDRPLPELPAIVPDNTWLGPSRKSSNASATPSVAPSLMSYVKNESFTNETVEYGQAHEVPMEKNHPGVPMVQKTPAYSPSSTSGSDYDTVDSPPNGRRQLYDKSSPQILLESPTDIVDRNYTVPFGDAMADDRNQSPTKENGTTRSRDLALDFAKFPHLQISEADWKRRTPSPQSAPRRVLSPRLERLWSTLRRNKSRSPLRDIPSDLAPRNYSTPHLTGPEVKRKHGNWI